MTIPDDGVCQIETPISEKRPQQPIPEKEEEQPYLVGEPLLRPVSKAEEETDTGDHLPPENRFFLVLQSAWHALQRGFRSNTHFC